jgi:hypothetical protein
MTNSLPNSRSELREPFLALLWRQWSALGVAGHVSGNSRAIIDPEALLLVSTVFARYDARLFDEMLDWLRANGTWINVLRLTRLQEEYQLGDRSILGALAEHLVQGSAHAKWKVLAKREGETAEPQRLFPHLAVPHRTDEIFLRWGWIRPPIENRGLSRPPRPNQPATFLLKLRALFGRQSRAEVLAWLLTHGSGHPAQIARETGYFRGSIQNVLNELELSGHVFATRQGREKLFAVGKDQWRFLLTWGPGTNPEFPQWLPWPTLFGLIRAAHDLIETSDFGRHSPDLQAIEVNRVITPLLARLAAESYPPPFGVDSWAEIPAVHLLHEMRRLIEKLDD